MELEYQIDEQRVVVGEWILLTQVLEPVLECSDANCLQTEEYPVGKIVHCVEWTC